MWIIIKSLLSISQQWFKGNTVKCVLMLHKWALNVWYDFRQSTHIFVLLSPVIYTDFFYSNSYQDYYLSAHTSPTSLGLTRELFLLEFSFFTNGKTLSPKVVSIGLLSILLLFFEGLQFYCPHFACITWINLWAFNLWVSTIYSRWENDIHLPVQSLSNLQINRRPNINFWPTKLLLMSRKFTIRLMYILGLIFFLPGCSAHNEERKSGFPRTDNYISITPLVIRMRKVITVWSFEMKPQ